MGSSHSLRVTRLLTIKKKLFKSLELASSFSNLGRLRCLFNFYINLSPFVVQKQRLSQGLVYIHSKPVVYVNNGGSRNTSISDFSGGLRVQYRPGQVKRTLYNSLRVYNTTNYDFCSKRKQLHGNNGCKKTPFQLVRTISTKNSFGK